MAKITKTIEIDAPVERVFELMANPNNLPEVWPSMVEVSNVRCEPDGSHSFDWVYKMAGMRFEGHADSTEAEKNRRVVSRNTSGIPGTFYYTYESLSGGRSKLSIEVGYELPQRALSKLAEPVLRRINEHEAEVLLKNVKARTEMGADTRRAREAHPAG